MSSKAKPFFLLLCIAVLCTGCGFAPIGSPVSPVEKMLGIEYEPTSQEDLQAAIYEIDGNVYWAPTGTVFHTSPECQAVTVSDELTTGTVEEAFAANRTRLCAFCAKRDGTINVKTDDANISGSDSESEAAMNTTVYWTKGGNAYHFTPDCAALADADLLFVGSTEEAQRALITHPCTICTDINK